jgi:hypothetical protein
MHNGLGSTSVTQATQTATVTTTSGRRLAMQIASSANADLVLSTSSKAPGVTSELKARAPSSGNLDFLVLLYPLDLSDTAPIVTDVSSAGTAALRIVDGNGDLVVLSSPAAQAASAEWLQATGEIAAAARTGTTAQFFQLVRGRSIDLGGVELFSSTQLVSVSARVLSDRYDYQLVPGSGVTATTVTFGALQAGATYRLYADGVEVGPCTALADGTVSFDQPLTASTYSLRR